MHMKTLLVSTSLAALTAGLVATAAPASAAAAPTKTAATGQSQSAAEDCGFNFFAWGPEWNNCSGSAEEIAVNYRYQAKNRILHLCVQPGVTDLVNAAPFAGWPTAAWKIADNC